MDEKQVAINRLNSNPYGANGRTWDIIGIAKRMHENSDAPGYAIAYKFADHYDLWRNLPQPEVDQILNDICVVLA